MAKKKILIVYDSLYGNTEKIAHAIVEGCASNEVHIKRMKDAIPEDLNGIDILVAGSPTHGGRASQNTQQFFDSIANGSFKNIQAAAFDTGIPVDNKKGFIRLVIRFFGYADRHIARMLGAKGAKVMASETFFVLDKEGPLKDGETERAKKWAKGILSGK